MTNMTPAEATPVQPPVPAADPAARSMLYPELFRQLEAVRWNMDRDIPWAQFQPAQLSEEQAQTIKMNAITEWAALRPPRCSCVTTAKTATSRPS